MKPSWGVAQKEEEGGSPKMPGFRLVVFFNTQLVQQRVHFGQIAG